MKKLSIITIAIVVIALGAIGIYIQKNEPAMGNGERITTKEYMVGGERVVVNEQPEGLLGADVSLFKPEVKLYKWGDETWIKVWSDDPVENTATQIGDKVISESKDRKREYHLYPITFEDNEAFEYEIILKSKPASNVITLGIESQGLDFFYQPPLTEEWQSGYNEEFEKEILISETQIKDLDENILGERPENIVGSYAVYHSTKKNHIVGQTNYMTGKAFHIYRPQMEDAEGWKVWGELHIENGILSVTIPTDFLEKAVYPIRHATGLTFGYYNGGTPGGTNLQAIADNNYCDVSTPASGGTLTEMYVYPRFDETDNNSLVLYSTDGSTATYESPMEGELDNIVGGEWNAAGVTDGTITAIEYGLCFWISTTGSTYYYYDSTGGDDGLYDDSTSAYSGGNPPASWAFTYFGRNHSIYADYTPTAADTCTPTADEVWKMDLQDHCTTTASFYSSSGMECYNPTGGSWVIANGVEVRVASSTNCIPQIESTGVFSIQPNQ